jgi:hypothetical protein
MPRRLIPFAPALLVVLALALDGCSPWRADGTPLPGGGRWQPLSPALLGRDLSAVQKVQGRFGTQSAVLVFYVEVHGDHLALVGTLPDGTQLFSLEQTGTQLRTTASPLLPAQMQPAAVLADLQMVYWPLAEVRANLAAAGLTIDESVEDGRRRRSIARADAPVVSIRCGTSDCWRGVVQFDQQAYRYGYSVETVQFAEEPSPSSAAPERL